MEKKEFEKLSDLSRLKFSESETEKLKNEFENILQYVAQLSEVNTDGIEPLVQVSGISNVFREDNPITSIGVDAALQNAPQKEGSAFKVPNII